MKRHNCRTASQNNIKKIRKIDKMFVFKKQLFQKCTKEPGKIWEQLQTSHIKQAQVRWYQVVVHVSTLEQYSREKDWNSSKLIAYAIVKPCDLEQQKATSFRAKGEGCGAPGLSGAELPIAGCDHVPMRLTEKEEQAVVG